MQSDRMLSHQFIVTHPIDAARILERLAREDTVSFLRDVTPDAAAGVIKLMAPLMATWCLEYMDAASCAAVVTALPVDIAVVLMRRMATDKRLALLDAMPHEQAASIRRVLRYPEGTAGAIMNPQIGTVLDDMLVQQAIEHLRQHPAHDVDTVFVVNREHRLTGFVNIAQLLFARSDERVLSISRRTVGSLSPATTHQGIVVNPLWQDVHILPVVDHHGMFLGAIDYRTLRRLEHMAAERLLADRRTDAGMALGELYWIGLSSFIKGMFAIGNRAMSDPDA